MACLTAGPTGPPDIRDFFMTTAAGDVVVVSETLRIATDQNGKISGQRVSPNNETFEGKCDAREGIRFVITFNHVTYFLWGTVTSSHTGDTLTGRYGVVAVGVAFRSTSAAEAAMSTAMPPPPPPPPEVGDTGTWGGSTGT